MAIRTSLNRKSLDLGEDFQVSEDSDSDDFDRIDDFFNSRRNCFTENYLIFDIH